MGSKDGPAPKGASDELGAELFEDALLAYPGEGADGGVDGYDDDGADFSEPAEAAQPEWDSEPAGIGENSAVDAGELVAPEVREDRDRSNADEPPAATLEDAQASLDDSKPVAAAGDAPHGDLSSPEPGDLSDPADRSQLNDAAREKARALAAGRTGASPGGLSR